MNPRGLFQRFTKMVQVAFLSVGPCFILLGLILGVRTEIFVRHSISAQAQVIAMQPVTDSDGDVTYAPIFTFIGANGKLYTVTSHASSAPPQFVAGQQVRILFEAQDPTGAKIDTNGQLWAIPETFVPVGAFLVGVALRAPRVQGWRARLRLARQMS